MTLYSRLRKYFLFTKQHAHLNLMNQIAKSILQLVSDILFHLFTITDIVIRTALLNLILFGFLTRIDLSKRFELGVSDNHIFLSTIVFCLRYLR